MKAAAGAAVVINARKRKQATSSSRGAVLSWRHGAYEQQVELGAEYGVHGVPLQVFLQKCWMVGASLEDVYIDIWGGSQLGVPQNKHRLKRSKVNQDTKHQIPNPKP